MATKEDDVLAVRQSIGRLGTWLHESKRWRVHGEMTMQQAWALYQVVARNGVRPGELSLLIETSPAATTAILDRLQRHGLVKRRPDPEDRRATIAAPTPEANRLWPEIAAKIQRASHRTFQAWSRQDLQAFQSYIARFLADARPPGDA